RHNTVDQAFLHAQQLVDEGAAIIDIGAYSSRPGAADITAQEEINRSLPIIQRLCKELPDVILSIDTFRADVAKACIHAGAHIINDISGGNLDKNMYATVAELQVPYIL